ncbi:MAG: hypothetical protein V7K53_03540 [Nostoc sp.]|uniref:hypothetical protein n=1 Tax=Nostoc sp. TaxID=1180 RepID=UPI002FFA9D1E
MEKATLFRGLRAYREKLGHLLSDFRLLKGFPEIKLFNFGSEDDLQRQLANKGIFFVGNHLKTN